MFIIPLSHLLGDITQKGYEKKRQRLLAPYTSVSSVNKNGSQAVPTQGNRGFLHLRIYRRFLIAISLSTVFFLSGDGLDSNSFSSILKINANNFEFAPIKASDGHSYVNSVPSLTNSNGGSSCAQHAQPTSSSGSRRADQRDYVNQPASGAIGGVHHHHHHSSQQSSRDHAAHQKHRRTQKRVTHNEKRYHSGNKLELRREQHDYVSVFSHVLNYFMVW